MAGRIAWPRRMATSPCAPTLQLRVMWCLLACTIARTLRHKAAVRAGCRGGHGVSTQGGRHAPASASADVTHAHHAARSCGCHHWPHCHTTCYHRRDLKSPNVLLDRARRRCKITDFGQLHYQWSSKALSDAIWFLSFVHVLIVCRPIHGQRHAGVQASHLRGALISAGHQRGRGREVGTCRLGHDDDLGSGFLVLVRAGRQGGAQQTRISLCARAPAPKCTQCVQQVRAGIALCANKQDPL